MPRRRTFAPPVILDEHAALRDMLASAHRLLAAADARPAQLVVLIDELVRQILEHFAHEEQDGYFAEAIDAKPRLSERAEMLLLEHAELARQLSELRQLAAAHPTDPLWRQTVAADFKRFLQLFSAHEAAENVLLQEAYQDDLGEGD